MENHVATLSTPFFYGGFVNDIYIRHKLADNVLFERFNSYHPNIKIVIILSCHQTYQ